MTDGAAVNTRVKDENGSTWRENKTVIAFTDKDCIKRKDGSSIIVKKEYSAYIGSAEKFKGYGQGRIHHRRAAAGLREDDSEPAERFPVRQ